MDEWKLVADKIQQSGYAIALTGAGISVESGIPDFRSKDGLWSKYDPLQFGHIDSFRANPSKVWKMLYEMDELMERAEPNPAHYALAQLEEMGILKAIITQNIDSLHQRAGSKNVIEFHGHCRTLRCDKCLKRYERKSLDSNHFPPVCGCGDALRPELVFFGEEIPAEAFRQAMEAARRCDLMIVVGTSATVAPASFLPRAAKEGGAFILEINPTKTHLTSLYSDMHFADMAGRVLPWILAELSSGNIK